jgi:RNAse (barnase) inhibitor barstar
LFYFNGENIFNKTVFFETSRQVMKFPDYFGNNWDAWEECVTDLSWVPSSSYLFVYRNTENFTTNSPQDWTILLDIFHSIISYWQQQNIAFFVILLK